jgi:hypothetical protein
MWILFRFSLLVFALFYRVIGSRWSGFGFRTEQMGPLEIRIRDSKNKKISSTEYRIPTGCKLYFRLRGESKWTRFCKRIGLGIEFQVGDPQFDEVFYVASDHPAFLFSLRDDSTLKNLLLDLNRIGFSEIVSTGTGELRLTRQRTLSQSLVPELSLQEIAEKFEQLRQKIESMRSSPQLIDRWLLPVLVFETAVWAIGAYSFGSILNLKIDDAQSLIRPWEVWSLGVTVALIVLGGWLFVVGILLRRSSRAPLLVSDLFFYVFLGVLFGGFQAVADLNRILDRSEPEMTRALITKRYSRTNGSGKNRSTSYFLHLRFSENPQSIPEQLRISSWDYFKLTEGQGVELAIRQGGLGFAYIDELNPVPAPKGIHMSSEPFPAPSPAFVREVVEWSPESPLPFGVGVEVWAEVRYPSGKIRQREPLVKGQKQGRARYWYENGQLYSEIPWVKDQKHGCFLLYRPDATIEQILSYREGKPHGLLSWHDASGVANRWSLYRDGVQLNVSESELMKLESRRPCRPPGNEPRVQSAPR